ncbi:lysozyme inhibitor LprI family protein [Sulfitobacter sp. LCG007]
MHLRGPHIRVAALAAALLPASLSAQDCANPVTQIDMNACAQIAWQQSDATLNQLWARAKPLADQMGLGAQLLDSQRAWLSYRDAACGFEQAVFGGGSIAPMVYSNCMKRLTDRRNEDLRGMVN